ncbi:unnamed protein product [Brugia pahangi]|uniref:DOCKER domain-containing protein n=1 Tax=Brugia pahangi TaxID=6280 RepID=A0A0N4TH67_BRUPA|nr:unnamed protein product [Brugia pahangi]
MISQHADCVDDASKCTQAIFSITQPLNDIFLVIKLEKVLQPCEVADACEPYVKEDKNKERLMQMAQQYCERLGAFRMPLGWFAIDLNQILNGSYHPDKTEPTMIASSVSGIFFFLHYVDHEFSLHYLKYIEMMHLFNMIILHTD